MERTDVQVNPGALSGKSLSTLSNNKSEQWKGIKLEREQGAIPGKAWYYVKTRN